MNKKIIVYALITIAIIYLINAFSKLNSIVDNAEKNGIVPIHHDYIQLHN